MGLDMMDRINLLMNSLPADKLPPYEKQWYEAVDWLLSENARLRREVAALHGEGEPDG